LISAAAAAAIGGASAEHRRRRPRRARRPCRFEVRVTIGRGDLERRLRVALTRNHERLERGAELGQERALVRQLVTASRERGRGHGVGPGQPEPDRGLRLDRARGPRLAAAAFSRGPARSFFDRAVASS
jgi:hypothetical protein